MTRRKVDVDLGLMSLPVGEDTRFDHRHFKQSGADPIGVARFRSVFDRQSHKQHESEAGNNFPSPLSLLTEKDGTASVEAESVSADIEYLWGAIGDGVTGTREVVVGLRREILPETTIHLFEAGGRLQIELNVGKAATRMWLASELRNLTSGLGGRLNRPLRVLVTAMRGSDRSASSIDWPEDFY
jgi:hypothetical protein